MISKIFYPFLCLILITVNSFLCKNQGKLYKRSLSPLFATTIIPASQYTDVDLTQTLIKANVQSEKLKFAPIFRSLAQDEIFVNQYWQKKPFLCVESLSSIVHSFTIEDVKTYVDKDFLEAGRGTFTEGKGGWNMAAVSQPRGRSFEEAKLRFEDIQTALKQRSGTVVFNSAGGFIPPVAEVCLQCLQGFDFPTAINMYLTAAGQVTSAPPHTDKQDVIVMQTQGQKRWRVYSPPPPKRMPRADPFARGKATDQLDLMELGEPLLDVVLSPGQILYVPGGFPHTTDTVTRVSTTEPSVHLTVGIDTHIWWLTFAFLRTALLNQNNLPDKLLLTKLDSDLYWPFQDTLPYGFLSQMNGRETAALGLGKRMKAAEPTRWSSDEDPEALVQSLGFDDIDAKFRLHHRQITDIFRKMYADVAYKLTPAQMDLSFIRSRPYYVELETEMEKFVVSMSKVLKSKK